MSTYDTYDLFSHNILLLGFRFRVLKIFGRSHRACLRGLGLEPHVSFAERARFASKHKDRQERDETSEREKSRWDFSSGAAKA
jgi:hypothetical protein